MTAGSVPDGEGTDRGQRPEDPTGLLPVLEWLRGTADEVAADLDEARRRAGRLLR